MKILEENHIQSKGKDISQKTRTYSLKFIGRKRRVGSSSSLLPLPLFFWLLQPFLKVGFQGFQQFCLHKVQKLGVISFGFLLILIFGGNDYCNFPKGEVSFLFSVVAGVRSCVDMLGGFR